MPPNYVLALDLDADYSYEQDISADFRSATTHAGRSADLSQPSPGTMALILNNNSEKYTPLNTGSSLFPNFHPFIGVQLRTSSPGNNKLFSGFVRKIFVHPVPPYTVTVDCADWLWLLSRVDISLPFMPDVQSHILAHRIIDLAEIGEHVDNPRFKDDLTDYSDLGTVTNTRVTSGRILEGKAVLESVCTAASSGWRYSIPHATDSEFQSKSITAVAYIWTDTDADVGESILLTVKDNVGSVGAEILTLTKLPQRIEVPATAFASGATDFFIEATTISATTTFRTGAVHAVFFGNAAQRVFDDGTAIFSRVAPRRTNALEALMDVANNELGGYVYCDVLGKIIFEDKHHRFRATKSTVSQQTIDDTMINVPYEEDAADRIGEVELGYTRWEDGIANSTVFQLFPVPRLIEPSGGTPLTIDGDYGAIVRDHTVPVANTDYKINRAADGSSTDESGNVTFAFEDFGGGFRAVFTSTVAYVVYLTKFAVRGTPVIIANDQPQEVYTPSGAPDYASKLKFGYGLQSDKGSVESWARYLGDFYVTQRERLPVALKDDDGSVLTAMLTVDISDRVTIKNKTRKGSTKIDGDYYVDSIEHIVARGELMQTLWQVTPVDPASYWILGTSQLGTPAESVLAP